jgi:MFS superfamily sulfate permease-like transporter
MKAVANYLRAILSSEPSATGYGRVGAILAGSIGAVAGLIVGLNVYAATAWFAVFEVGIPAAVVGALLGFVAGGLLESAQSDGWDDPDGN